jgi:hypothetical protein
LEEFAAMHRRRIVVKGRKREGNKGNKGRKGNKGNKGSKGYKGRRTVKGTLGLIKCQRACLKASNE